MPAAARLTTEQIVDTPAAALALLRATVEAAPGERRQPALPQERAVRAEQAGHRTLAAMIRHHRAEGARP
ncbi:hypothetical protein [Streptomyces sp. NPDC005374]|uniref:hypothetical protein n=1 Tax=Streptomyces sp. NPDC005374 TaxID=3364713 RepID=UPI0036A11864